MGYYSGDPGFFSIVKHIAGGAVRMIPGVGGLASKMISKIPTGVRSGAAQMTRVAGTAIIKHPVISAAGAAGAVALGSGAMGRAGVFGRPAGKHPTARHMHALAMGLRRARPRMNVTNVHALRRALRRTHGFAKLAMRVIHITHPKKKGRFGGFRKRHRK
jgi:hypothetical protein